MNITSVWYGFILLLSVDFAVIYFFAFRYIKDETCLKVSWAIIVEYCLSWIGAIILSSVRLQSPLRWIPLIVSFFHLLDNVITVFGLLFNLKKNLRADKEKTVLVRGLFKSPELIYKEGMYSSYKKQMFLAIFLKLTVIFSSVIVLCYALSNFIYFGILNF